MEETGKMGRNGRKKIRKGRRKEILEGRYGGWRKYGKGGKDEGNMGREEWRRMEIM